MSSQRHKAIGAAVAGLILVPALGGCWAGFGAQTSQQANQAVGNGSNMTVGPIEIRGATWVRDVANPSQMTLVATFVGSDGVADRLIRVETDPVTQTGLTDGSIEVPVEGAVRTGFLSPTFINAFGVTAFPSAFVSTTFTFERAGAVSGSVLSVTNTGQYADVVTDVDEQIRQQKVLALEQARLLGDEEAIAAAEKELAKFDDELPDDQQQADTGE